jgi:aldehyde:ferredoxin oxidoreductase
MNPIYFLMYSTGEKINITQIEGGVPQAPFATREEREAFVKDWIQVPDEKFKEYFLNWEPSSPAPYYPSIQLVCELVDWQETMHYIDDSLGVCAGLSSFPMKPPYHIHNLPQIVSAATGLDIDKAELWKIARRNRNLVRAINVTRGLRRKDERPPEDHWKKRFPEYEAKLLDEYYAYKGWNREGIPTQETLRELDLAYVAEVLQQRGFAKDGQD